MKKILFPTDLSEAANKAFIYALHFADKLNASLIALHVYYKPEVKAASLPRTLEEFYKTFDLEEFENYKDAIPALRDIQDANGFNHLNISHTLVGGDRIVDAILDSAKKEEADIIVMGTTGARGLKEIFLGSVAGEVLENAECLVLAVPENATFDGVIDNIGMTTTYHEEEKEALKKVLNITAPFEPTIHCVNVDLAHIEPFTKRMDAFSAEFANVANINFDAIDGNNIQEVLAGFMEGRKVDMLAMVTHKRNFLQELFNYSRTKQMSYHSKTPILSIPAHIL
ncbi:MAG: universal stress protein [Chitinophagales bacterium]|nr:universal stress protein [Chitinophagales bacterium]